MYKDGKQYDKFILNGKTYDKFYLNNKQYGGGYVPFATPILDLDFQNNFIDKSPSALTMVQGQGLPTFGLSGRKAGEYCAVFNGSQSIKTTTNLPINSDKVTIAFWMKTTQTAVAIITELSPNTNTNNAFMAVLNNVTNSGKLGFYDRVTNYNNKEITNVNNNTWMHVVAVIDRSKNADNGIILYLNGVIASTTQESSTDNNGNFVNNILFIGQRAGSSLGFNGYLTKYQVFNKVPTDAQAMEMYQNDL